MVRSLHEPVVVLTTNFLKIFNKPTTFRIILGEENDINSEGGHLVVSR